MALPRWIETHRQVNTEKAQTKSPTDREVSRPRPALTREEAADQNVPHPDDY